MKTPGPEFLFSEADASNLIKKETLAQVFSCEFWEIAKGTSFRTPTVTASIMRFIFEAGETLPLKRKWSYF